MSQADLADLRLLYATRARVQRERTALPRPALGVGDFVDALVVPLGLTVAVGLLVLGRSSWAADVVLVPALLTLPGLLLVRAIALPAEAIAQFPAYVPGASLIVLTGTGLAVDLTGLATGVTAPLRTTPLLTGLMIAMALLSLAAARAPARRVPWPRTGLRLAHVWPLLLPALAAAGAARLNAGNGNQVAVVALALTGLALLGGVFAAGRVRPAHANVWIYAVSLALLWSVSMRGSSVYGFDINSEFHLINVTNAAGVWHPAHANDAYGAMLSLTVLPVMLHVLTGASDLAVVKFVYPATFALFPVAVFSMGRRFVPATWAFVAADLLIVQSYFFEQLPAIARQEIGLFAFVILIAALVDPCSSRAQRAGLASGFGALLVVSHYTTAYTAIGTLIIATGVLAFWSVVRRRMFVELGLVAALLTTAGGAAIWYGAVTHSASNLTGFASSVRKSGLALLPTQKAGENPLQAYLNGNSVAALTPAQYQALARKTYATMPFIVPLRAASKPRYDLQTVAPASPPVRRLRLSAGLGDLSQLIGVLVELLAIAGAATLAVRRRVGPRLRMLGVLGLATLGGLIFVRLSGTAAEAYNQSRAFLQALVSLSVCVVWGLSAASRKWRRIAPGVLLLAVLALGEIFVVNSGLAGLVTGGNTPGNVSASGEDVERFTSTPADLAGAAWLNAAARNGSLIFADRYAQLRILQTSGRTAGVFQDVTPETVDQHGWVYADTPNIVSGRARAQIGSGSALYRFPSTYLDDRYDTVFSDGTSKVWHR